MQRFHFGSSKDMSTSRISLTLKFGLDFILHLFLFVLFLIFFGIPTVHKYLAKETIVISSVEETNGIEAPAITIIATQTNAMGFDLGWKTVDDNMSSIQDFNMVDHCKQIGLSNVEAFVSNDTFALTDFLKEARMGISEVNSLSLLRESTLLWTEDITTTSQGRYFTVKPWRTISRKNTDALVFNLDSTSSFSYIFWVHDEDFFLTNINPFSTPSKLWWIKGNELNGTGFYRDLTLTKHKRLNQDRKPCEHDLSYSFTALLVNVVNQVLKYWKSAQK